MLEEREFRLGRVFTVVYLRFIVIFIGCRVAGFACILTWSALVVSTISYHSDDVLSYGFS